MNQKTKASNLLSDVSFAAAFANPTSAVALCKSKSDIELWQKDGELVEPIRASAAISRLTWVDGPVALVLKGAAWLQMREIERQLPLAERGASRTRQNLKRFLKNPVGRGAKNETQWLDALTPRTVWPLRKDGRPETPIDLSNSESLRESVMLTPYQLQAAGLIEYVRASGNSLRVHGRSGDYLADVFSSIIIAFSGLQVPKKSGTVEPLLSPARWLEHDFHNLVSGASISDEAEESLRDMKESLWTDGKHLPGNYQHLAVTILSSWLRMARLGVRLSSRERLEEWQTFFDGVNYGSHPKLLGEAWRMSEKETLETLMRYDRNDSWLPQEHAYWADTPGGVPNVFVGMTADCLHAAIVALSVPSATTKTCDIESLGDENFPKIKIQLDSHYEELASSVAGSIRGLRLVNSFRRP